MTLQVVLQGSDGIVIASDTCVERVKQPQGNFRIADFYSKIVVADKLAYTFSGDDCAKEVGAAVAQAVSESPQKILSAELIYDVSTAALKNWRKSCGNDRTDYRKIIWVQAKDDKFIILAACCNDRAGEFEVLTPDIQPDGKCRAIAGDEFNKARYIVECYYDKDAYSLRTVSSLKTLAAHVILTGSVFNSAGVGGLEMVVGKSGHFTWILQEDRQKLEDVSRKIHAANDSYFNGQTPRESGIQRQSVL
jgi:hypothetical protein